MPDPAALACLRVAAFCVTLATGLLAAAARANAADPGSAAPITTGGTVAGIATLAPHAPTVVKPRAATASIVGAQATDEALSEIRSGGPGIASTITPNMSENRVRARLRALDRQADRGRLSLEEYRARREQILHGY